VTLPVATANMAKLIAAAQRALDALWRPGYRYKKAGVMLLELVKADRVRGGLFDAPDHGMAKARKRVGLGGQIFVPRQQALVHCPLYAGQDARPIHNGHPAPTLCEGVVDRPKTSTGPPPAPLSDPARSCLVSRPLPYEVEQGADGTILSLSDPSFFQSRPFRFIQHGLAFRQAPSPAGSNEACRGPTRQLAWP
jgi:hypothetical protein